MIGLALMTMMAIFGSSASASTDDTVKKALTSQFIVSNVVQQPFATSIADEIRKLDGVRSVAALKEASPKVDGKTKFVGAVDPKVITEAVVLPVLQGSLSRLGPGTMAVDATAAQKDGLRLGSTVRMTFQGGTVPLEVVAVYAGGSDLGLPYLVTDDTFLKGGLAPLDSLLFVTKDPGADTATVRAEITKVLKDLPTVTVKDPEGFAAEQRTQVNQFLSFIYGLLALSVVIAALGVVNTLSLSVIERTREVGLLRAVGISRRQLRTMIRLESLAVAVFGAVLGLLMGTAFGLALVRALKDDGLTKVELPWVTLVAFVLVAALIGVLAAVFPARRAARLDVLRAITTD
jgi:putative ABC transport system permease protein